MRYSLTIICIVLLGLSSSSCNWDLTSSEDDPGSDPDTTSIFQLASSSNLPSGLSTTSRGVTAVDIDNDGDLDLAVAMELETNKLLINDGSGNFQSRFLTDQPLDSRDIVTGSFNGDTFADLFSPTNGSQTSELAMNNGDGTYSNISNRISVTGNFTSSDLFDIGEDGAFDILIGGNGQNQLLQNNGNGFFSNQTSQRLPQISDVTRDVTFGDITGNNSPDIIVGNEGPNKVLINNGTGFFTDQSTRYAFLNQAEESREVALADVDNDGDLDLYVANSNFSGSAAPQDRLLINDGSGFFSDGTADRLPTLTIDSFVTQFADLDGDNDLDIAVGNYNGGIRILLNNGSGFFSDHTADWIPDEFFPQTMDLELADYNGDGKIDIYIAVRNGNDQLLLQQ